MVFWLFLCSLWLSVAFADYHKLLVSLLNLTVVYSVAVQELSVGFFCGIVVGVGSVLSVASFAGPVLSVTL